MGIGLAAGVLCLIAWALAHRDLMLLGWKYGRRIKIE